MIAKHGSSERLRSFSDGVFSVVITILVLELHAPSEARWGALAEFWPEAASYAASYLFIAIVWVNHHHLLRFADLATPRLIWFNFAHLFSVSWLPFATSWVARTRMGGVAVFAYAAVFVMVNVTYIALCNESVDRADTPPISKSARGMMRMRSIATLTGFALGGVVALFHPIVGFCLVCACLVTYLRPDTGM